MAGSPEASTSSDHVEVEWQLDALDLRPVERWLGTYLPAAGSSDDSPWGMVQGEGRTRVLTDVYLDTEDWRVFRAGFALRTRKQGKAAETTLKSFA
ncbi:MAG TPA: hypothetical protein VKA30_09835, partial [Actinomycetota bacterium]|nr:hypothetical protein [Actinomycetota bacterium]